MMMKKKKNLKLVVPSGAFCRNIYITCLYCRSLCVQFHYFDKRHKMALVKESPHILRSSRILNLVALLEK